MYKQVRHCHDLRNELELRPWRMTGKHKNNIEPDDPEKTHSVHQLYPPECLKKAKSHIPIKERCVVTKHLRN